MKTSSQPSARSASWSRAWSLFSLAPASVSACSCSAAWMDLIVEREEIRAAGCPDFPYPPAWRPHPAKVSRICLLGHIGLRLIRRLRRLFSLRLWRWLLRFGRLRLLLGLPGCGGVGGCCFSGGCCGCGFACCCSCVGAIGPGGGETSSATVARLLRSCSVTSETLIASSAPFSAPSRLPPSRSGRH